MIVCLLSDFSSFKRAVILNGLVACERLYFYSPIV